MVPSDVRLCVGTLDPFMMAVTFARNFARTEKGRLDAFQVEMPAPAYTLAFSCGVIDLVIRPVADLPCAP